MRKNFLVIFGAITACATMLSACGRAASNTSGGAAPAGGSAAPAENATVYEFNISHIAAEADPIHQGWTLLKDTLEEKSGGRIKVNIFGNKQLSNSNNEDAEKVQQNIVQATSVPTSSLYALGNIKEYQVFDYPYMFEGEDELYAVCDSDFMNDLSVRLADVCDVRAYGGYNLGWCQISTNKGPINSPNDLFNQKIRTMSSDLQMAIVNSTGAGATIVNYGELFTACQQGTVDGMMTSTGLYVSDRFYECQKYMGVVHVIPLLHVPIVNNSWYESLPEDLQQIFDESMGIYLEGVRKYELEFEANALSQLKALGMQVREYNDDELEAFKDVTAVVYTDYADIVGQDTIDTVRKLLGK